ncbi:MAG: response regulator transcription factor [Granulosicoccus sp.]
MPTVEVDRPIILVEDNARDREYFVNALPDIDFKQAERGDLALDMVRRWPDAWLVSDIQLPGITGIDLSRAVWEISSAARIIIWSQYNDEVYLRALAQIVPTEALYGYVLKTNPVPVLRKAVISVFQEGQCWIDPSIRTVQARANKRNKLISDGEYDVLIDIALGLTDNLIAERRCLSRRGVQGRLKSLYTKLDLNRSSAEEGINPRSRAVALALGRGLINTYELEKAEQELIRWRASPRGAPLNEK